MTKTLDQHIEITPGICGGKPRIAGHRIRVQDIAIWHEKMGLTADDISADYSLSLADIYSKPSPMGRHHLPILPASSRGLAEPA